MAAANDEDGTRTSNEPVEKPEPSRLPQRLPAPLQVRDPGRYAILAEHGRGGLGKVARAHDNELGRNVAIKELIKRGDVGEVRFLREALITARLEHPGIVPIHEAGRWPDGTPFYVMKLVAGRSLKEVLAERPTVEQRIALLHHVIAVADAIAYAHTRKIIHRDLKPANVIIGDFGETVVIDWGLAKDLAQPEESTPKEGPYRTAALTDLTETGTVLGTPTYMAPEQWRGEAVDQRADVFAIGAMLWELCSTSKVPPADSRHRDRLLRQAGIDRDLGTIVAKALSQEAEKRYQDAGELAADLRAFTSGARIASRRYSLLGMAVHWMRRHRSLAATIGAGAILAAIGTIISVLNIADARDEATRAQRQAEEANAELVLENAELLMTRDPTAVVATLSKYRGTNSFRRQRLLAEARGRGVAEVVLKPHSDTIWFLAEDASGAIFSLSEDLHVRVTENGVSKTLANDLARSIVFSYSAQRHLLAYVTVRGELALLDLKTRVRSTIKTTEPAVVKLSQDGMRLAVASRHDTLEVWSLAPRLELLFHGKRSGVWSLEFWREQLVAADADGLQLIPLNVRSSAARSIPRAVSAFDARSDYIIAGNERGVVALLSANLELLAEATMCRGRLQRVRVNPLGSSFAFACHDGTVGILAYDSRAKQFTAKDSFVMSDVAGDLIFDETGQWLVARSNSNVIYIYSLVTNILTKYEGQAATVGAIATSSDLERVLVGDAKGTIRVWKMPPRNARVSYRAARRLHSVAFNFDDSQIAVGGADGIIRRIDVSSGQVEELRGHSGPVYVRMSDYAIASIGADGTARVWSGNSWLMSPDHGFATDIEFWPSGTRVVSTGSDGRLITWSPASPENKTLFKHTAPLVALEVLRHNGHIVTGDMAGSLWVISPGGAWSAVRRGEGAPLAKLKASPSGRRLAIGTSDGIVAVYDTESWAVLSSFDTDATIRQLAFDPKDRELMIASENGILYRVSLDPQRSLAWYQFPAQVRDVAYSQSGDVVAFASEGGGIWFCSMLNDDLRYVRDRGSDTFAIAFSRRGDKFVSVDDSGAVIVREVSLIMRHANSITGR